MPPKRSKTTTSPVREKKKKSDGDGTSGSGGGGSGGSGGRGSGGAGGSGDDGGGGTGRSDQEDAIPMTQAEIQNLVKMAYEQGVEEGRRSVGLDQRSESDDERHLRRRPRMTPHPPQPRRGDQEQ